MFHKTRAIFDKKPSNHEIAFTYIDNIFSEMVTQIFVCLQFVYNFTPSLI